MIKKLCILCVYRDREDRVEDFIAHYTNFYPEAEIIFVRQMDSEKFKKGQLYNIGFINSDADIFSFIDIDIRLPEKIDFCKEMEIIKGPFYGYSSIYQCHMLSINCYRNIPNTKIWKNNPGGLYTMSREQYEKANGHSNLYIGYGFEDDEIKSRASFSRLPNTILHISHAYNNEVFEDQRRNKIVFENRNSRSVDMDGYRQTEFKIKDKEDIINNVVRINVCEIGVCKDFKYERPKFENLPPMKKPSGQRNTAKPISPKRRMEQNRQKRIMERNRQKRIIRRRTP